MSSMNDRRWPQGPSGPSGAPDPYGRQPQQGPPPGRTRGGIPDGAIVGLLATLLGTTALVWFSTALGALLTHGHLPHPLPFAGTPGAIRSLALEPNRIGAAWPGTPVAQLPSPTAFWVTFFVLLALLIALALTVLTAWMRIRAARHAGRRVAAGYPPESDPAAGPEAAADRPGPDLAAGRKTLPFPRADTAPDPGPVPPSVPPAPPAPFRAPVFAPEPDQEPTRRLPPATVPLPTPPLAAEVPRTTGAARAEAPDTPADETTAPQAPAREEGPFAFPAGMTALLVPTTAATAAKRRILQRAVDTATGPVLVVTDDLALWRARPPHRDARLFDPLRLVDDVEDAETRVRWAPHDHCDDPATAATRARALLAPTLRGGAAEARSQIERGVRETAQTLLRCWLHAAALDRRPFRHIQRWASGTARNEAPAILRSAAPHRAADGWDGELEALLAHSTDQRDAAIERILGALDILSELQVQQACAPSSAADALDVETLLGNRGTLYVLGRASETRVSRTDAAQGPETGRGLAAGSAAGSGHGPERGRGSAMPLLTALVEDIVERARRTAVRSSSGRLDPPLLCVLDNVAAVAPFPGLPELLARGGPLGLGGVAVLRSPEQARSRWDERAVHSLWTNADARAVLGPLDDTGLESLLGTFRTAAAEVESAVGPAAASAYPLPGGLGESELLLLADRRPARRFATARPPVPSGSHTAPQ